MPGIAAGKKGFRLRVRSRPGVYVVRLKHRTVVVHLGCLPRTVVCVGRGVLLAACQHLWA